MNVPHLAIQRKDLAVVAAILGALGHIVPIKRWKGVALLRQVSFNGKDSGV